VIAGFPSYKAVLRAVIENDGATTTSQKSVIGFSAVKSMRREGRRP